MPVNNIVFFTERAGPTGLDNFDDTVILRLQVQDQGLFLIIAKVCIYNSDRDSQNASARLTTLDGRTELDRAPVRIAPAEGPDPAAQEISLHATMSLPSPDHSYIIDLRCSTYRGSAFEAKLFAVLVDRLQQAGV
jgi:hypothetical protein